jgi:hypothetical protein
MTDFFSDLERQLTAAANERAQRIRRARARRGAALGAVLLALVAAGAGVAAAVSSTGDDRPQGAPAVPPTTTTAPAPDRTVIGRSPDAAAAQGVTVAVLNGTAIPGLARGVASRLQKAGFKIGNVTNASSQVHSRTLVLYDPAHVPAAAAVSHALGNALRLVIVIVGTDGKTGLKTTTAQHR